MPSYAKSAGCELIEEMDEGRTETQPAALRRWKQVPISVESFGAEHERLISIYGNPRVVAGQDP